MNMNEMNLDLSRIFTEIKPINTNLIRCTKKHDGRALSHYYIDLSDKLPRSEEDLKSFQDEILGMDYFSSDTSVQWNFYLLFVLSPEHYKSLKNEKLVKLIENNKQYTRKFVLSSDEVHDFFDTSVLEFKKTNDISSNLATRWIKKLKTLNLQDIATKKARAVVIRNYLDKLKAEDIEVISDNGPKEIGKRLDEIKLLDYREYPHRKDFTFGNMNLFVGPNGVGKTSLLEAIELIYCGGTLRSEGVLEPKSLIHFKYSGEEKFEALNIHNKKIFQERDLHWYGKSVTRGNELFENFNKYNFFNADSAFKLAHDSSENDIDAAFSSLALGEQTNILDKRLNEFKGDFQTLKNSQERTTGRIKKEITELKVKIDKYKNNQTDYGQLYHSILISSIENIDLPLGLPEQFDGFNEVKLSELMLLSSKLDQVSARSLGVIPLNGITVSKILNELVSIKKLNSEYTKSYLKYEEDSLGIGNEINQSKAVLEECKRLKQYIENDRFQNMKENEKQLSEIKEKQRIRNLAIDKIENLKDLTLFDSSLSAKKIPEVLELLQKQIVAAKEDISKQEDDYNSRKLKFNSSRQLIAEIRLLAEKLVQNTTLHQCPVCSTPFSSSELTLKINALQDKNDSDNLSEQFNSLSVLKSKMKEIESDLLILKQFEELRVFLEKNKFIQDPSIKQIRDLQQSLKTSIIEDQGIKDQLESLNSEAVALELSSGEFDVLKFKLGFEESVASIESLLLLEESIKAANSNRDSMLQDLKGKISNLTNSHKLNQSKAIENLNSLNFNVSMDDLDMVISRMTFVKTEIDSIEIFKEYKGDLTLIHLRLVGLIHQFKELLKSKNEEINQSLELSSSKKKLEELEQSLVVEKEKEILLKDGLDLIEDILKNDSKEKSLESFIENNRSIINKVFTRIHSPNEFSGLVPGKTTLIRRSSQTETPLNQVSTGQRAALAVSLFLSLNLSLKDGPPVILIDDPVAHVDDLNTLSFLDLLRDLVLSTNRQIFFATANLKLAGLIQKKFEFLGSNFKRYDLDR